MAYVSLYRKYRPQTFADVMGQEHVTRTLQNAIKGGRIAHGYLFTGTRGTAKTTIARLLAKAVNCDRGPAPEPCNTCDACVSITSGACIDVIEMDAASHRGVADIEEVRKAVGYGPMQFRYKVFIIDEAHQLSSDAKDAFLKTLEEPPDNVVFILATTEPQSIPITIRSRCQQFDFKRGSLADIAARLRFVLEQEGVTYTADAVNLVARNAEGSWRDALSLLEQVLAFAPTHVSAADVDAVLGTLDSELLGRVIDVVARRDAPAAFALAGQMLDAGKEARTLLRTLSTHFRDLLLVSVGGPAVAQELTPDEVGRLQQQARLFSPPQMMRAMDLLNEAQGETRWNNQHRLLVELTFLKLMNLGDGGAAGGASVAPSSFATAPIVFPTAVQSSAATSAPPVVPAPPSAPAEASMRSAAAPPPVAAGPAPETAGLPSPSAAEAKAETPDELPAAYFADDDAPGGGDDNEDDDTNYLADAEGDEPVLAAGGLVGGSDEDADDTFESPVEVDTGPSLFDDEPAPVAEADLPAVAATPPAAAPDEASRELAAVLTTPAPTAFTAEPDHAAAAPTLDEAMRAWPRRFLMEAERISKQASVMLASAVPSAVVDGTLVITFAGRANYEMMSLPKKQEFVRKLLGRTLGRETVPIRLALDTNAPPPPPKSSPKTKKRVERDIVAAVDDAGPMAAATDGYGNDDNGNGSDFFGAPAVAAPPPRPSMFAASAPPPPPAAAAPPRVSVPANRQESPAPAGPSARTAAALEDPFVQEALSIFGGEIIDDDTDKG